jgi:hypothetical protein
MWGAVRGIVTKRLSNMSWRLFILLGLGLVLGACTKCDIPTPWENSLSKNTPGSCHDEPKPQ